MFVFKAAVVGAGTMGAEIAHVVASAGIAAEKDAFVSAFTSDDAREGIAAFLGKRAPHWNRTPARP